MRAKKKLERGKSTTYNGPAGQRDLTKRARAPKSRPGHATNKEPFPTSSMKSTLERLGIHFEVK